jgi:rRNA-processing protein FCF1
MPDKVKNLVRARMQRTGESYQTALRHVAAQAPTTAKTGETIMYAKEAATAEILAVLDTNVLLDIYSSHDLLRTYERLGEGAVDDISMVYRRARARESLLVVNYFNKVKADTFSLYEAIEQLERHAPSAKGGTSFESAFTRTFIWFVRDYVLPDWEMRMPKEPGNERSNEADQALIRYAKELNLPLITNEGYTQAGIVDRGLRLEAKKAGVQVFTPKEFYTDKIEAEDIDAEAFLSRFREQAPRYIEDHHRKHGPDKLPELLTLIFGVYRHIFRGETEGRSTPVRVAL